MRAPPPLLHIYRAIYLGACRLIPGIWTISGKKVSQYKAVWFRQHLHVQEAQAELLM